MADQPEEIRCLGSQVVYQNRWMKVREDQIQRPSGHTGIYGVVEKPRFAVIAAVDQGYMHLVEQYRYPVAGRYWELPQGQWDLGPIDPLTLAAQELREETGLIAGHMQHVGALFLAYGFCNQAYDVFLATDLQLGPTAREPEEEGMQTRAFAVAEVQTMICTGRIQDASTVAAFGLLRLHGLI